MERARALLGAILAATCLAAQDQVTIELPTGTASPLSLVRGRLSGGNQRLVDALAFAWEIDPLRVIAPGWFRDARYDFRVDAGESDARPILREAIEKKFAIIAGFETRPLETWVLERSELGATFLSAAAGLSTPQLIGRPGFISGSGSTEMVARMLQHILNTEVVDETGTAGRFRFSISWPDGDTGSMLRAIQNAGLELVKVNRAGRVLVVYSAFWPDAPKTPRHTCEPGVPVRDALEKLVAGDDPATGFDVRMELRKTLVERFPEDIFVGMAAQEPLRDNPEQKRWWDWALATYRSMSDRTGAAFLEARLRDRTEGEASLSLLSAALRQEPDFGRAYLAVAELTKPGAGRDGFLTRFRHLCPVSVSDAPLYDDAQDSELMRSAVESFSRTLSARTDTEALRAYPYYWRLRKRTGPAWPPNWLALDVARVRQLDRTGDAVWISTVKTGYEMLGDNESVSALLTHIEAKEGRW